MYHNRSASTLSASELAAELTAHATQHNDPRHESGPGTRALRPVLLSGVLCGIRPRKTITPAMVVCDCSRSCAGVGRAESSFWVPGLAAWVLQRHYGPSWRHFSGKRPSIRRLQCWLCIHPSPRLRCSRFTPTAEWFWTATCWPPMAVWDCNPGSLVAAFLLNHPAVKYVCEVFYFGLPVALVSLLHTASARKVVHLTLLLAALSWLGL